MWLIVSWFLLNAQETFSNFSTPVNITILLHSLCYSCFQYSHGVYVQELHVHGVYGREDGRGPLHHAFPGLRHGDRRARGQKDGLVAAAQGQETDEVSLHQHDLQRRTFKIQESSYKHKVYNVQSLV